MHPECMVLRAPKPNRAFAATYGLNNNALGAAKAPSASLFYHSKMAMPATAAFLNLNWPHNIHWKLTNFLDRQN